MKISAFTFEWCFGMALSILGSIILSWVLGWEVLTAVILLIVGHQICIQYPLLPRENKEE